MIQTFLTFNSMDKALRCDYSMEAVEQYSTVVLFVFRFYPVCKFGKFINFGPGTVRSERGKLSPQLCQDHDQQSWLVCHVVTKLMFSVILGKLNE